MRTEKRNERDYRIVPRAVPVDRRGYLAAVTVQRVCADGRELRAAYQQDALAGGYLWPSARAARLFALAKAQEVIRYEPFKLSC